MYGNITAILISQGFLRLLFLRLAWQMRLFMSWSLKTFPVSLVFYELACLQLGCVPSTVHGPELVLSKNC